MLDRPAMLVLGLCAAVLWACGAPRAAGERRGAAIDRNIVLGDELERFKAGNLLDALRNLRPQWLRPSRPVFDRNSPEYEGPLVYLDGRSFGTTRSLGLIQVRSVVAVRYYTPSEAHGRFGPGHLQGVIDVTSGPEPL
jgi:hypothetical protein